MLCSSFPRRFDSPLAVTFSDSFSCRPASGSTPSARACAERAAATGTALRRALQTLYGGLSGTSSGVAEVGRATALRGADGAVVAEEDIAVATGDTAFLPEQGLLAASAGSAQTDRRKRAVEAKSPNFIGEASVRMMAACYLRRAPCAARARRLHGLARALTAPSDGAYKWRHQVVRISVDVAGPNLTHTHRANGLSGVTGRAFVPKNNNKR